MIRQWGLGSTIYISGLEDSIDLYARDALFWDAYSREIQRRNDLF